MKGPPAALLKYEAACVVFPSRRDAEAALAALRAGVVASGGGGGGGGGGDLGALADVLLPPALDAPQPDGSVRLWPVSKEAPTRASAQRVREELAEALAARHTRQGGVCAIRQELHFQACGAWRRALSRHRAAHRPRAPARARAQLLTPPPPPPPPPRPRPRACTAPQTRSSARWRWAARRSARCCCCARATS